MSKGAASDVRPLQASAHALSTVDMPLPRSKPTANALLAASNHFCYLTVRQILPPASSSSLADNKEVGRKVELLRRRCRSLR